MLDLEPADPSLERPFEPGILLSLVEQESDSASESETRTGRGARRRAASMRNGGAGLRRQSPRRLAPPLGRYPAKQECETAAHPTCTRRASLNQRTKP